MTPNAARERWSVRELALVGDDKPVSPHYSEIGFEIVWTGRRATLGEIRRALRSRSSKAGRNDGSVRSPNVKASWTQDTFAYRLAQETDMLIPLLERKRELAIEVSQGALGEVGDAVLRGVLVDVDGRRQPDGRAAAAHRARSARLRVSLGADEFSIRTTWLMMPMLYYIGLWLAKRRYQ